jgi:hypothetical protein
MFVLGYIDPGSGQLLWQVLIAAGVGLIFYVKKTRDILVRIVSRLFNKD